jgi:hypothetical protein
MRYYLDTPSGLEGGSFMKSTPPCSRLNPMPTISDKQLHDLARLGAIARLKELDEEAAAIRKMFPGLKNVQEAAPDFVEPATKTKPRKRKQRSLASRKAARVRMKLYWAKKRGEAPAEAVAAEKAEATDAATTTPVAPAKNRKKPTKKAKKASSPKKAKGRKKG